VHTNHSAAAGQLTSHAFRDLPKGEKKEKTLSSGYPPHPVPPPTCFPTCCTRAQVLPGLQSLPLLRLPLLLTPDPVRHWSYEGALIDFRLPRHAGAPGDLEGGAQHPAGACAATIRLACLLAGWLAGLLHSASATCDVCVSMRRSLAHTDQLLALVGARCALQAAAATGAQVACSYKAGLAAAAAVGTRTCPGCLLRPG
jgi:hypothetical protein